MTRFSTSRLDEAQTKVRPDIFVSAMGAGASVSADVVWAELSRRMTNVKVKISSSSLLNFSRKLGEPLEFVGSGSCKWYC